MGDRIHYFFDQHMHSAVANGLCMMGIDVLTAHDAGRCGIDDPGQLHYASLEERVMVTHDPDFLALAAGGVQHGGITFLRAVSIPGTLHAIAADPDDDKILECAEVGGATHIVPGDRRHLLPLGSFNGIAIVTAADFLAIAAQP